MQVWFSCCLIKGREKKRVWRHFCEWLSAAMAHLPTAVSLLLLEALFMQISGVSLTLTWPLRLCLLRVLLRTTSTLTSFPLSKHTGGGGAMPTFCGWSVYLQFTWEVGLPLSPLEFSSHCRFYKLSHSRLLGRCHRSCLLQLACLFTVPGGIALPLLFGTQGTLPSLLCVFLLLLLFSLVFFSFFPGWGSVCPGGYADLAQGCLWEYQVMLNSPCGLRLPKRSGSWHLAIQEPSGFCLTWSGDAMKGLGVWRSQSFASSRWFFL
jgi:hypothetical protein